MKFWGYHPRIGKICHGLDLQGIGQRMVLPHHPSSLAEKLPSDTCALVGTMKPSRLIWPTLTQLQAGARTSWHHCLCSLRFVQTSGATWFLRSSSTRLLNHLGIGSTPTARLLRSWSFPRRNSKYLRCQNLLRFCGSLLVFFLY